MTGALRQCSLALSGVWEMNAAYWGCRRWAEGAGPCIAPPEKQKCAVSKNKPNAGMTVSEGLRARDHRRSPEIPACYKKEPVRGRAREIQETASLYGLIRVGQDSTNWNYHVRGSLLGQTHF